VSLRSKTLLIILAVVLLSGGLNYAIQRLVGSPSFVALEQEEAKKDMERCAEAIRREIHHLDALVHDWAAWDDTYAFVKDRNKAFVESNVTSSVFEDQRLNILSIFDLDGKAAWSETRDFEKGEKISIREFPPDGLPKAHPLFAFETRGAQLGEVKVAGICMTEHGPMLVASRPILTSDNEGPIKGSLVMGRFLDDDAVQTIVEQTRVTFHVWPIQGEAIPQEASSAANSITPDLPFLIQDRGADLLWVYTTLPDIQGRPVLLLRSDIPREILAKGKIAMRQANLSTAAVGILVLMVLLVLLRRTVIGPITKLTDHAVAIGKSGDLSARLTLPTRDEIGTLSRQFDGMVQRLAEAQKELLEQSYYAGMAETAAGALHNVRNGLTSMMAEIDVLRQDLKQTPFEQIETARRELTEGDPPPGRKADLSQFLDLAGADLAALVREMGGQLDGVARQAGEVERILSEQDKFSRAERPLERIGLEELINDSMSLIPDRLRKAACFEMDASLGTMQPILAHRAPLVEVFGNLLANAVESIQRSGVDGGEVRVCADFERVDGVDMVHVQIRDNGEGIDASDVDRIFQRGYSAKQEGSGGTGLHWCANTIASMNGKIHATSDGKGRGACLHVLLPKIEVGSAEMCGSKSDGQS